MVMEYHDSKDSDLSKFPCEELHFSILKKRAPISEMLYSKGFT